MKSRGFLWVYSRDQEDLIWSGREIRGEEEKKQSRVNSGVDGARVIYTVRRPETSARSSKFRVHHDATPAWNASEHPPRAGQRDFGRSAAFLGHSCRG